MTYWVVPVHDPPSSPEPDSRTSRLRTAALASAVALVLALPLAFVVASPSDTVGLSSSPVGASDGPTTVGLGGDGVADGGDRAGEGGAAAPPRPSHPFETAPHLASDAAVGRRGAPAGAFCGAERRVAEGAEAQACVLTRGAVTWGRVYYRNDTGTTLTAALSVRQPDGETVEVTCDLPPSGASELCETPRRPTVAESGEANEAEEAEEPKEGAAPAHGDTGGRGNGGPWVERTPASGERDSGQVDESYAVAAELTDADGEPLLRVSSNSSSV